MVRIKVPLTQTDGAETKILTMAFLKPEYSDILYEPLRSNEDMKVAKKLLSSFDAVRNKWMTTVM